jgi:hypothetical protein
MLAHIYPGGTVTLEQTGAGGQRWIIQRIVEQLTLQALMVKNVKQKLTSDAADLQPVAPMSYRQAIKTLLDTPLPVRGYDPRFERPSSKEAFAGSAVIFIWSKFAICPILNLLTAAPMQVCSVESATLEPRRTTARVVLLFFDPVRKRGACGTRPPGLPLTEEKQPGG